MYVCWILIVPQDPFLYRNSIVYVFGDVTRSAGLQSLHQAREILLLLVDFATLVAQSAHDGSCALSDARPGGR